jgi:hypothetical protein
MIIERIQILSDAENDLYKGKAFYDKQGNHVGDYFFDSLLSDIESLAIYAGIHKKEFGFYRMLAKRFPYAIYYDLKNMVASVVAVLPMRKDPLWLETKMGRRR